MTNRRTAILVAVVVLACLPGRIQPQDTAEETPDAPVISKAVADFSDEESPQITVVGSDFGITPQVFFGKNMGSLVPLALRLADESLIVANLPADVVSGTYTLVVQAVGARSTSFVEVEIDRPAGQRSADPESGTDLPAAPPSDADLMTAKTIFVHHMPQDMQPFISARLAEKGPYKVVLDQNKAELWVMGTATGPSDEEEDERGEWQRTLIDIAAILAEDEGQVGVTMTASVYIVARGSDEILWSADTSNRSGWVSSNMGPRAHMAKEIVRKLNKELKKQSK